jgi:hypothetical protein
MKRAANICGITSVVIASLYWACITLPEPYWPIVCPWHHSDAAFFRIMLVGIVLGLVAGWMGSRWWIAAAILAGFSMLMGGLTV